VGTGCISRLYAFGYGLSYTTFSYSNIRVDRSSMLKGDTITVSIDIKNSGKYDGDELVQLYLQQKEVSAKMPVRQLQAIKRISLKKDEIKTVSFALCKKDLSSWNDNNEFVLEPGEFNIQVGSSSDDRRQEIGFNMTKEY
jgi:beta-glucosidase